MSELSRPEPLAVPVPFTPTGDAGADAATAARLLDEAVRRRIELCLRPDVDGQDVAHRAERLVRDSEVRELLELVEAYERRTSGGQVGR